MTGLFLLLHSHARRSSKSRYDCCSYRCNNLYDEFDGFFLCHNFDVLFYLRILRILRIVISNTSPLSFRASSPHFVISSVVEKSH